MVDVTEEEKKETTSMVEEPENPGDQLNEAKKKLSMSALMGFQDGSFPEMKKEPRNDEERHNMREEEKRKEAEKEAEGKPPPEEGKEPTEKEKAETKEKEGEESEKPDAKKQEPEEDAYKFKGTEVTVRKKDGKKEEAPVKQPSLSKEDVEEVVKKTLGPKEDKPDRDADLPEDVREQIALWEYGEQKGLAEKGTAESLRTHMRERAKLIEKLQSENADDEDYDVTHDRKYKQWTQKNKLNLTEAKRRKIEREQDKEEAFKELEKKVREETNGEIQRLRRELNEVRVTPKIEKLMDSYEKDLTEKALPEDLAKAAKEKGGLESIREDYEVEVPIVEKLTGESKLIAKEFLSLRNGQSVFDSKNKYHDFIYKFVDKQAKKIQSDPKRRVKDGKEFIHPYEQNPDKEGWTFGEEDVLEMLKQHTKQSIQKKISAENERLERIIAKRTGTQSTKTEGKDGGKTKAEEEDDSGKDTSTKSRPTTGGDGKGGDGKRRLFSTLHGEGS